MIKHDLHGELHDGIDYIIGIVLEGLDSLGLGDIGLRHDQLHILLFHARGINLRMLCYKNVKIASKLVLKGTRLLDIFTSSPSSSSSAMAAGTLAASAVELGISAALNRLAAWSHIL